MTDYDQIEQLYRDMYAAMVRKNQPELERVHDDGFVLHHMTGKRQNKEEYINAIMEGTLNYYEEHTDSVDIIVKGDKAGLTGRSRVMAAVFGGERHTWRLLLKFGVIKRDDGWKLTEARASTY